jgi:hypothetical protein
LNQKQNILRLSELLKYVDKEDLEKIGKELSSYQDQDLFKIAAAIKNVAEIDLTKATPDRHLQRHLPTLFKNHSLKPKKLETNKKTKDDFDIKYPNRPKKK